MNMADEFQAGDRVRIRNEVAPELYGGLSTMGNEGVIKKVEPDNLGLPRVWIEWDKNHWTYNHAPDGWTFPEHFELIERKADMDKEELAKILAEVLSDKEPEAKPESAQPESTKDAKIRELQKRLAALTTPEPEPEPDETLPYQEAHEYLDGSEGFILITVHATDHPKAPNGVLMPVIRSWAKNPVTELLLSSYMSELSAQTYQELVKKVLSQIPENE